MRFPLTALAAIGLFVPVLADEPRPDLREYKTVANAKTTSVQQLSGLPKQPAHLGVYTEADTAAVRVAAVEPASPADVGGLRVGDRIEAVEGHSTPTVDAFRSAVTALVDGDRAVLTVDRDGKSMAIAVALAATSRPMSSLPRAILGVQMVPADNGVKIEIVTVGDLSRSRGTSAPATSSPGSIERMSPVKTSCARFSAATFQATLSRLCSSVRVENFGRVPTCRGSQ